MQMNVAGLRRNIKNLAHNYSDAQVKVREATSNDPWGPSSTIMAEIADLTYNVVAFSEIMQMIWKRTNDHGKNWRHVYKALLLLEYLIKTGSEKVAQQCKENIFSIQTLKDFQHLEEGKDQGVHVREKAKQLVILLKDDERLKAERARALKAKERFARTASGFGSDGSIDGPSRDTPVWPESDRRSYNDMEFVRPQTVGEEELQLQLAIAMSKEEADQEESKRRSDDVRLQLALSQSEQDFKKQDGDKKSEGALVDLLDISFGAAGISSPPHSTDAWGLPQSSQQPPQPAARSLGNNIDIWSAPKPDPWLPPPPMNNTASAFPLTSEARMKSPAANSSSSIEGWLQNVPPPTSNAVPVLPAKPLSNELNELNSWPVKADPWATNNKPPQQVPDPWNSKTSTDPLDPWAPLAGGGDLASGFPAPSRQTNSALAGLTPGSDLDEFDIITNRSKSAQQTSSSPANDMMMNRENNNLNDLLDLDPLAQKKTTPQSKTQNPAAFLGENSALVNLDNLIKPINPSSNNNAYNPFSDSPAMKRNLFQQNQPQNPSMNQLKQQQQFPVAPLQSKDPWAPVNNSNDNNQPAIRSGWMLK
ncbi:epsin-2 isoform X2 [Chironomus tepperi]|uniref:epsin-2 isoform X2 n=1 Tax=Chironomus tepperi TaxID=113505 RepID=UPI00391FC621